MPPLKRYNNIYETKKSICKNRQLPTSHAHRVAVKAKPVGCIHFFAGAQPLLACPQSKRTKKMTHSLDSHRPAAFQRLHILIFCFFSFFRFVKKILIFGLAVYFACPTFDKAF